MFDTHQIRLHFENLNYDFCVMKYITETFLGGRTLAMHLGRNLG